MVFGKDGRKLVTVEDVQSFVLELFDTYTDGCVLLQEAKLFFKKKGYSDDECMTILLFGEEVGFLRRGCDDLERYTERLKRIGEYEKQLFWLKGLGYDESDGFVEVYARALSEGEAIYDDDDQ